MAQRGYVRQIDECSLALIMLTDADRMTTIIIQKKRRRIRKENAVHENNNDEDDERISKNTTRHISECVRLRLLGTAILVLFAKVDNIRWQMDDGGCIVDA